MTKRLLAILLLFVPLALCAQSYPDKPVRMVVIFPPGGAADVLARLLATRMQEAVGQTFVVDNRPGAGGAVAAEHVAKSPADGYTILFGTSGTHGIVPALQPKLRYRPVEDFAPIARAQSLPSILVVHADFPPRNVKELIEYARARPGKVDYASAGNGSTSHLATELLKATTGIKLEHVPYKGGQAAMADVVAGRVPIYIETAPNALPQIRAGKVRALAVTSAQRSTLAPDIPSMAEAGVPGYNVSAWTALFAPAGTPDAAVRRLAAAMAQVAKLPEYRAQIANLGAEPLESSPEELAAVLPGELAKWARVVKESGAKID